MLSTERLPAMASGDTVADDDVLGLLRKVLAAVEVLNTKVDGIAQRSPLREANPVDVEFLAAIHAGVGGVTVSVHDLLERAERDKALAAVIGGMAPRALGRRLGQLCRAGRVGPFQVVEVKRESSSRLWSVSLVP